MNQTEAMKLLLSNRVLFIETLLSIMSKDRQQVPFILNPIQRNMLETSTSGRDVYVKPAQIGASSLFIADALIDCITIPGTISIILSYDEFIAGRLLRKAQNFYDTLSEVIPTLPKMSHKSTSEKIFPDMQSSFYLGSARAFTFGRGEFIHDLIIDEYAFWPPGEPEKLFSAAMQRVPLVEGTKVRILSTPNGEDNDFHEIYRTAKEGKAIGNSVFTSHFYEWFLHPEYQLSYDNPFVLPNDNSQFLDFTEEEDMLAKKMLVRNCSIQTIHDKIRWRRYKMAEMASARRTGETRLLFGQEYPEDDLTCFLAAGGMVYDADIISDLARKCYPSKYHTLFADIWYPPEKDLQYLVAIDPGVGKASESVATVWHITEAEYKHCATLSGFYDVDKMADMSIEVANYYNGAKIANEDALSFTSHIKKYSNVYYRTDPVSGRVSRDIGWLTTKQSKPYMIAELNKCLPKITTHDIRLVSQLRNIRYIPDNNGRDRAVSIGADDYHDSACIAMVCRDSIPSNYGLVGVSGWNDNWGRRR